jgi:hypothetical protein
MANTKISALTSATTPLAGTEVLPIVQSGATVKVAVSDLTAGRSISVSGLTNTGLTASKPVFTDASKVLTSTGVVPVANGGTGLSSFTANGIAYASSTSALATGSALTFDGTNFATTGKVSGTNLTVTGGSASGNSMYLAATNEIAWSTNGSERIRVDASGNFLQNTSSTLGTTWFNLYGASSSKNGIAIQNSSDAGTIYSLFIRNASNTLIGSINNNGSATAFSTSSDYRLKHDVQPMTNALAKVVALKPVTYKWNSDNSESQGFIAHELAEIVPEAVSGEKDAVNEDGSIKPQGIDTSFLVATLTAAIQEQQTMIQDLQSKLKAAGIQGFN